MVSIAAAAPGGESHIQTVKMGRNESRNGEAAQRRGGGDTRRSPPAYRRGCLKRGFVCRGFATADASCVIVCASFARIHHSIFTLSFSFSGDPSYWRIARRVLVISVIELQTKEIFDTYGGIGLLLPAWLPIC